MGETEQRLEQYGRELDREVHPVGLVELAAGIEAGVLAAEEASGSELRPRQRSKWWMAIAAAVLALVLFLPALAYRLYTDGDVAGEDDQATSTTEMVDSEQTAETTVSPPTTAAAADRQVLPNESGEWSVETSLGTFTWTRIDGPSVPEHVQALGDGFISVTEDATWFSDDGITWEQGAPPGPFAESWVNFMTAGDQVLATANPRDEWEAGPGLYRLEGEDWVEVPMPEVILPEVEGMTWPGGWGWPGRPSAANGVTILPFQSWGSVDWGAIYGTYPIDDPGAPEDIPDQPPWAEWDEVSETVRIRQPDGESLIAVLTVEVVDDQIVFRDQDTGDIVTTVGTDFPGATPDEALAYLVWGGYTYSGLMIDSGSGFALVDAPWIGPGIDTVELTAHGDGFIAAVLRRDPPDDFQNPDAELAIWRSGNGVDWELLGSPQLTEGKLDWANLASAGERLIMNVVESTPYDQSASLWTSTDGVSWEQVPVDLGMGHPDEVYTTEFGFVLMMMSWEENTGADYYDVWLSPDGVDWERVPQSPEVSMMGAGGMGGQVAGDTVFVTRFVDGGSRTLWIGRLER